LSHPQAHVKKNAQAQKAAGLGNENDMNHMNGLNNMPTDGMVHPFGMVPVSDGMNNMAGDQSHLSRSSSANQDRNNMAPSMGAPQPYGANVSNSMNNQQMPSYSMPQGQNGMPMYGGSNGNQQAGLDWSQVFQAGAHQPLNNNLFHPPNRGQTQIATKTGPNHDSGATDCSSSDSVRYSLWGIPTSIQNPYPQLSNQILNFLYPPNEAIDPTLTGMNLYFSPDNTKDFLDQYTHFHKHVPILHPNTLRIMEAHPGLAACMCCIGACYSNRVAISDVQEMMEALWTAMERDCRTLSEESLHDAEVAEVTESTIEELQAVLLTSILHVGNGTSQQRHRSLRISPMIAAQARRLGLLAVSGDPSAYSALHHARATTGHDAKFDEFDWLAWIGQELRVRLMHALLAQDTLLELSLNAPVQFDPSEIHLPLPCDDAAWNASSADECASALGLNGDDAAQSVNPHGTRRAAQAELHLARQVLLDVRWQIKVGATNYLGKVLLAISMIALIRLSQKMDSVSYLHAGDGLPSMDWIVPNDGSNLADNLSAFEETSAIMDPHTARMLYSALSKLRGLCDADSTIQGLDHQGNTGVSFDSSPLLAIARHILVHPGFANQDQESEDNYTATCKSLSLMCASIKSNESWTENVGKDQEANKQYDEKQYILDLARIFTSLPSKADKSGSA
jgi:hypothetical protein